MKNPNSSEKDRSVPAKVQKLGVSPPSPVREPEQASLPLAEVQNSGASPPSPAPEPERASSPLAKVHELGGPLLLMPKSRSGRCHPWF